MATAATAPPPEARTQPERPDAFVSYSRKDEQFVRRLAAALDARDKDIWVDWEDIRKTADWRATIEAGIDATRSVVAVLSPDFADSEICRDEVDHAVRQNKRLIPIVRREVDRERLRPELNAPNWIFFRESDDFDASLDALVDALETDLAWIDAHARLLVRALEWDRHGRDRSFLLRGSDLAAAERWLAEQGSHRQSATPLQAEYVVASRQSATRRQRITLGAILVALAVAVTLAIAAVLQRNAAIANEQTARSRELAARSNGALGTDPELAVLLAVEAAKAKRTPEAEDALRAALGGDFLRHTLRGHGFFVENARFDRSGKRVLTAGNDTARLWDAASGRPIRMFRERGDFLNDAALSPRGDLVATVGGGATASLWEVESGRRRVRLGGEDGPHGNDINAVEFSPNGRLVATASDDDTTALWDASSGRRRRVLRNAGGQSVAFSPNSRVVVTAGDVPRLWSATSGRLVHVLKAPGSLVERVTFSPDGRLVAAALTGSGNTGTARIWDVQTGRTLHVLEGHTNGVQDVAFDPSGKLLATGSADSTAAVWRVADGRRLADLRGHASFVSSVAFSPDSRFLLTGSEDSTARVWEVSSGRAVAELPGHTAALTAASFSPDGGTIVTASNDETTRLWRAPTARPLARYAGGLGRFGGDGRIVLTRTLETLFAYDRRSGRRVRLDAGAQVFDAEVSPDGASVLAAADDETATIWNARSGKRRVVMSVPATVEAARFSPDGRTVALAGDDGAARLFRTGERKSFLVVRHPKPPPPEDEFDVDAPDNTLLNVAFAPGGDRIVTASADKSARVWDARTGRLVTAFRRHGDGIWEATFSPDGDLVSSSEGFGARVWDAHSGRLVLRLPRVTSEAAPRFSPDGTRVLAIEDKTLRVREVGTGRVLVELRVAAFDVAEASFSADGKYVVAGYDDAVRIWDAVRGTEIETILAAADGGAELSGDNRFVLASGERSTALYACELCRPLDDLLETAARRGHRALTADERRALLHE